MSGSFFKNRRICLCTYHSDCLSGIGCLRISEDKALSSFLTDHPLFRSLMPFCLMCSIILGMQPVRQIRMMGNDYPYQ